MDPIAERTAESALLVERAADWLTGESTEFVKRARRGPLAGRPEHAVFECPFEVPRFALETIDRWKQPMVPEFKGGPRFVKIGFTDASWARVKTDEEGLSALVGPDA